MTVYGPQANRILRQHGLRPNKRFGQNFLVNRSTAEAIVRAGGVSPQDNIVEVGVGLGALTLPLAQAAARVYGFEVDGGIVRYHREQQDLPENVQLIHQDILKADLGSLQEKIGGPLKILANLPYSISNPFLFKLIDNAAHIDWATVMVQKEVADRLCASVNTKEYGVPTVLLGAVAELESRLILKPDQFYPKPKIDSTVVKISFTRAMDGLPDYDFSLLKKIVRISFNQRRKTLHNTLGRSDLFRAVGKTDKSSQKDAALSCLRNAGIDPKTRPESLPTGAFIALSKVVLDWQQENIC